MTRAELHRCRWHPWVNIDNRPHLQLPLSCHDGTNNFTLQGTNISHLGKRKIIFKMQFLGDMLVPWRLFGGSYTSGFVPALTFPQSLATSFCDFGCKELVCDTRNLYLCWRKCGTYPNWSGFLVPTYGRWCEFQYICSMINQSLINSMPKAVSTRPEYADFDVFFAGARHQACASQSTRVMLLCLVGNVCLHSLALLHACPTHTVLMQCSLPCSTLIALMILMFASILIMLFNTHYIKCITILRLFSCQQPAGSSPWCWLLMMKKFFYTWLVPPANWLTADW